MENEIEIWKPIVLPVDLNGRFEISSEGRFRRTGYFLKGSKLWKPEIIRKLFTKTKYIKVMVRHNKENINLSIHRLVCWAFHPNPENKPQVNHLDGDKHNNRANNVEWATQSENIQHAQSIGIMKYAKLKSPPKKRGRAFGTPGIFKKIIDTNTGEFYTSDQLAALLGTKRKYIHRILSEERKPNTTQYKYV